MLLLRLDELLLRCLHLNQLLHWIILVLDVVVVVVVLESSSELVLLLESSGDLDGCRGHFVVVAAVVVADVVAAVVVVDVVVVQAPIGSSRGSSN